MPELPEVETVCRVLSKNIIGLTIKKVEIINKNLRYPLPFNIKKKIIQTKIKSIIRNLCNPYMLILFEMSSFSCVTLK